MRITQLVLFTAIAVLSLASSALAVPSVVLGNYDLLPNMPGQKIPLYITGIVPNEGLLNTGVPNNVLGIVLDVAINDGGPAWGSGLPGPIITKIDVFTGPTIWVPPNTAIGPNVPAEFYGGQLADINFILNTSNSNISPWVHVSGGLLATVEVDTTGFSSGTFALTMSGGAIADNLGGTSLLGRFAGDDVLSIQLEPSPGTITIVPEPSSVVFAAIGLIGLAAWGWRRRKRLA